MVSEAVFAELERLELERLSEDLLGTEASLDSHSIGLLGGFLPDFIMPRVEKSSSMTLEDELLDEIRMLDTAYESQLESWDIEKLAAFTYLGDKRDAAFKLFADEFAGINTLKGVLAKINNAPERLEDLNARLIAERAMLSNTQSKLRSKRRWHVVRYIGAAAAIVGVPVSLFSVGALMTAYYWGDYAPHHSDGLGFLTAAFTFIAVPASLAGIIAGIKKYCKNSTYLEVILKLEETILKQEDELESLGNQIAAVRQYMNKNPEPIKRELASLQAKYDKKVSSLEQVFDSYCAKAQQKYDNGCNGLKEKYMSARRPLVNRLEHLREQSPDLSLRLLTKQFVKDKYSLAHFQFHNKGIGEAKDVNVYLHDEYQTYKGDAKSNVLLIEPGKTEEIELRIKPTEYGEMKWSVKAEYKDVLGRPYSRSWPYQVEVVKEFKPIKKEINIKDSVVLRSEVSA